MFRPLKPQIKKYLVNLFKFFFNITQKTNFKFNSLEVRKILVFAYNTGLGNFILYTPTLRSIKNFVPNAKFTLLLGNDCGFHEILSGSNLFEKYITIKENASLWKKIKCIYKIRKEKFDLIVSEFHNNVLFLIFLIIFANSKYRLGHISSSGWSNRWDFIYNIPVKMKDNEHEIDRYLELVYVLGASGQTIEKKPTIIIDTFDEEFVENFFNVYGINNNNKIICVHSGSSQNDKWKRWGVEKYSDLCNKILGLPNIKLILLGTSEEIDLVKNISSSMMKNNPIIAAGKTTVKQVAAIIKNSDLLICNDSGLMHVAVAVDTPVVAIYGPTDHVRTAPQGDKHIIIRKNLRCSPCFKMGGEEKVENCPYNYKCLNSITADEVFEVVSDVIH